jgi:hypothetical protein
MNEKSCKYIVPVGRGRPYDEMELTIGSFLSYEVGLELSFKGVHGVRKGGQGGNKTMVR